MKKDLKCRQVLKYMYSETKIKMTIDFSPETSQAKKKKAFESTKRRISIQNSIFS